MDASNSRISATAVMTAIAGCQQQQECQQQQGCQQPQDAINSRDDSNSRDASSNRMQTTAGCHQDHETPIMLNSCIF
jgi:hypothetical protein